MAVGADVRRRGPDFLSSLLQRSGSRLRSTPPAGQEAPALRPAGRPAATLPPPASASIAWGWSSRYGTALPPAGHESPRRHRHHHLRRGFRVGGLGGLFPPGRALVADAGRAVRLSPKWFGTSVSPGSCSPAQMGPYEPVVKQIPRALFRRRDREPSSGDIPVAAGQGGFGRHECRPSRGRLWKAGKPAGPHMCAMMLSPKAEHLISVAPSICRAKS